MCEVTYLPFAASLEKRFALARTVAKVDSLIWECRHIIAMQAFDAETKAPKPKTGVR